MLVFSASFYRPLVFWADNAWELGDSRSVLLFGGFLGLLGVWVYWHLARLVSPIPVALGIGIVILVLTGWQLASLNPLLLLGAAVVGAFSTSALNITLQRGLAAVVIAFFGLGATVEVALAHATETTSIPVINTSPTVETVATGTVEDVLVVVVADSYPTALAKRDGSLSIRAVFDPYHEPSRPCRSRLLHHLLTETSKPETPRNPLTGRVGLVVSDLDTVDTGHLEGCLGQRSRRLGRMPPAEMINMNPIADLDRVGSVTAMKSGTPHHLTLTEDAKVTVAPFLPVGSPLAYQGYPILQRGRLIRGPRHPRMQVVDTLLDCLRQS